MSMDFSPEVFEHSLDKNILEQIDTLRTIRINIAESMLHNLPTTSKELYDRGLLVEETNTVELRRELEQRILLLRSRLTQPHVVYVDEIKLYMDLVEGEESDQDSEQLPQ